MPPSQLMPDGPVISVSVRWLILVCVCAPLRCIGAAVPVGAPAAPSGLVASAVSPTRVDLAWTDNSDNESAFVVERRTSPDGDWTLAWDLNNASFPSLSDMGLTPGVCFEYRVKARTKAGDESGWSNVAVATTPGGPPLFNNLLRDRPAAAGSFQWRKVPPYQAVDGTQWTRWWSKLSPENAPRIDWLQVDMGARRTVDKIRIIWQRDWWARKYEIQVSDDAGTWQTAMVADSATFRPIDDRRFAPVAGRFLRFHGIESANRQKTWGGYGSYSFYEFEAYAPGVEPDPLECESSATRRPVSATTRPELALGAVDAHLGTFWSAKHGRENSYTIDLGEERDVHQVQPYWHVPVDAYKIRFSVDGETWCDVADQGSVTRVPVANEELREIHTASFTPSQRARHVRLTVTGNAVSNEPNFAQIILQELLVHCTPAGAPRMALDLRAHVVSADRVRLGWTDASVDETGFEVERRELGTSRWQRVAHTGAGVERWEDTAVAVEKSYVYRVRAVNSHGASLYSNTVRIR